MPTHYKMPTKPLTHWKCDNCGEIVDSAHAYVVWNFAQLEERGHSIIHRGKCDNGRKEMSAPLKDFLGLDGLAKLTSLMAAGIAGPVRTTSIGNMREFVDFFRRVQLPHYEEARDKLRTDEVREEFRDASEVVPYLQDTLKRLAEGRP